MDQEYAAMVIKNLNINYQTELFNKFSSEKAASVISLIEPDDAADILFTLDQQKRHEILTHLNNDYRHELEQLLHFAHTPIGEHLTTEFFTAFPDDSIKHVLRQIKEKTTDYEHLSYVYVLNKNNQLVGVCNMHELLLNQEDTPLYKFMISNLIAIHLNTPEEIAISKMLKYKLYALPVIDREKHILGIITLDSITEYLLAHFS